jgi:hypothetical protein
MTSFVRSVDERRKKNQSEGQALVSTPKLEFEEGATKTTSQECHCRMTVVLQQPSSKERGRAKEKTKEGATSKFGTDH